ncbi:MAG: aldo/keto reductase [Cytophagales bacterium]|nr:aldo/keto reductase [Armatimonadota bacterium]
MRSIAIPNTDLTVSALCLGTADMGTKISSETAREMLNTFGEAGGNFFDTARVYADWVPGGRHASEKTLGRWLMQTGCRDRITLATKGAHPELSTMDVPRLSPEEIAADVDGSLRDLGTDRIDLWYLHRDDPAHPVEAILETLWRLVDAGKIRYLGCSNWTLPRLEAARVHAAHQGRVGFVANQPLWNAAVPNPGAFRGAGNVAMDSAMRQWHAQTQTAAVPYSSQANGLFQKLAASGGDLLALPGGPRALYGQPENLQRFERIRELYEGTGLSLTQITLGYLFAHPFPVSAIVGPGNLDQLTDTLTAAGVRLTPEQTSFLEAA